MIRFFLVSVYALSLALTLSSCSRNPPPPGLTQAEMERLVMIEFASKLEEDYHKLHPYQELSDHPEDYPTAP